MPQTLSNSCRAPSRGIVGSAFPLPGISAFFMAPPRFAVGMASAMMRFWVERFLAYAKPLETLAPWGLISNLVANSEARETTEPKENERVRGAPAKEILAKAAAMPTPRMKRRIAKPKATRTTRPTAKPKAATASKAKKRRKVSTQRKSGR